MDIPPALPPLFDAGLSSDRQGDFSARADGCVKAGADAVCIPDFEAGFTLFPEAASAQECAERAGAMILAARGAGVQTVGAVLEPTGLLVPPLGESDFEDVYAVRRAQTAALSDAGADFLLLDRQTSLADMRAGVLAARGSKLPAAACWDLGPNCPGEAENGFLPALATVQAMGAAAVGFCGVPCKTLFSLVREALACSCVPLVMVADASPDSTPAQFAEAVRPFAEAGVRIVGCGRGTKPLHLRALRGLLRQFTPAGLSGFRGHSVAATEREIFFLGDDIEFSEPLRCTSSLAEDLIELEDEQVTAALVAVESIDDAVLLGREGSVSKLPIGVLADSATILEAALRYFQGRLLVDSRSPIEPELLEPLAAKYGAIIC